jgi:hypothetical protein
MTGIVKRPGTGLARPTSTLISDTMAEFVGPLQVIEKFRQEWCRSGRNIGAVCLGEGDIEPLRFIDEAKRIHSRWLRHFAAIRAAYGALFEVLVLPNRQIDHPTALRMLTVLFSALGKRKTDDENAALLLASADMFSTLDESIGGLTGLWKPIDRHPLILAIAIKQLIATAVFTSAAELREAMAKVRKTLETHAWAMKYLGGIIERADRIVFAGDRAAWRAAYADIDAEVVALMQGVDDEGGDDDDGNVSPPGNSTIAPSPRWLALGELIEARRAIERQPVIRKMMPLPTPRRAACATKPAKRIRRAE